MIMFLICLNLRMVGIPREPLEFVQRCACSLVHSSTASHASWRSNAGSHWLLCRRWWPWFQTCAMWVFHRSSLASGMGEHQSEEREPNDMPSFLNICKGCSKANALCLFKRLLEECDYPDAKIADELTLWFSLVRLVAILRSFSSQSCDLLISTCRHFDAKMSCLLSLRVRWAQQRRQDDTGTWQDVVASHSWMRRHLVSWQAHFDGWPASSSGAIASPRFGLDAEVKAEANWQFLGISCQQCYRLAGQTYRSTPSMRFVQWSKLGLSAQVGMWSLWAVATTWGKHIARSGIAEDHLKFAWISVWSPPDQGPRLFRMESMPFGATASVGAFLRLSQALKCLGITRAALVWSSFYDDFVCVCPASAADQVDRMIRMFFQALGWQLSTDEAKDHAFSETFQALGVEFDLRHMRDGFLHRGQYRKVARLNFAAKLTAFSKATPCKWPRPHLFRSRLLFADAQVFGRFAKAALHEIGRVGLESCDMRPLSASVKGSLTWLKDHVLVWSLLEGSTIQDSETYYLFLDGACTDAGDARTLGRGTSIGGVLVFPDGSVRECFGEILPPEWMRELGEGSATAVHIWSWDNALRRWACFFGGIVWKEHVCLHSLTTKGRGLLGSLVLLRLKQPSICCT